MSCSKNFLVSPLHSIQNIGFLLAQLNNSILITLIWKQASSKFGSYRHIMVIFSVYSLMYSWVELAVLPVMHTEVPVFVIMVDSRLKYHIQLSEFLVALYCGSFALCISLLAGHFVYRYLVVCKPELSLDGYNFLYILLPCPVLFLIWFSLAYWGMEGTTDKLTSFKSTILENYSTDLDTIGFSALAYWYTDENGVERWNRDSLISILGFDAIIGSCLSVIIYCGFGIYADLKKKSSLMSGRKIDLQRQLFYTLALQTLLPFVLMYMTVGFTITTPLLSLDLGEFANVAGVTVAIYPCLEPCIAIVCIKDFRRTLMFWKTPVTPAWTSEGVSQVAMA